MKVLLTGANGFIGRELARQLLADGLGGAPIERLVALDLQMGEAPEDARWQGVAGSVGDPAVLARALVGAPDVVFHLASLPGGAAERQSRLGRQVNLDATVALFEALTRPPAPPRLVYASSVAVYGADLPNPVTDDSPTLPGLSYGAHKLVGEILLADAVRRGDLRGCALRLPGVVARPGDGAGLMSAFMSRLFWHLRDGVPVELPVRPEGTAWWISVRRCALNLRRAAIADLGPLGPRQVALMPALHLSVQEVVEALVRRFGSSREALVRFSPQEEVDRLFARQPPMEPRYARAIGLQDDGSADALVRSVLGEAD